jgi:hypothetical protein
MIKEIMENRKDPGLKDQEPTSEECSNYLGRKMAVMLPEGARGIYK